MHELKIKILIKILLRFYKISQDQQTPQFREVTASSPENLSTGPVITSPGFACNDT